ncbi:MAG: dephospho-CoA kinase [Acidimicrobiia bacterium]
MAARLILSGGIGSGKSTAASILQGLGAVVFSSDEFARRVLAPETEATRLVLERWPEVGVDGVIDRARLGRLVFSDAGHLTELERIVHPYTRQSLMEAIDRVPSADVVVEMPIIRDWFEGWTLVVVDAADEVRLTRAASRTDEMVETDVRAVMGHQPSRAEWLLAADLVIDNGGDMAALESECRAVWNRVTDL